MVTYLQVREFLALFITKIISSIIVRSGGTKILKSNLITRQGHLQYIEIRGSFVNCIIFPEICHTYVCFCLYVQEVTSQKYQGLN